jgi:hypothetical protein
MSNSPVMFGAVAILALALADPPDPAPAPPEQHAGDPIRQVQVVDLDGPAHRVLVIVDGAAYGVETVPRADGGGNPPPEEPDPPPGPGPDPAVPPARGRMADAAWTYFRGIAANYASVGQRIREGSVKGLDDFKAATATARDQAANRLERALADDWGKAEAVGGDGAFLKPAVVADSLEKDVFRAMLEVLRVKP